MKKVLSIIVSYNFEPWLDKCLSSLLHSELPTDILVIDNASTDRTVARIRAQYPRVRLIANTQNLGFGKANNIGMKLAIDEGYDFAFLVNQDAWVAADCLSILTQAQEPTWGILSPTHMDGSEKALDTGFANYIRHSQVDNSDYKSVDFINAAFWLIPISVLKKVGGFSPIFYHYGEDKDFANRIRFHQLKTVYHPNALAYHDRQNRISTIKNQLKADYVFYLTEYCNINYSGAKAFKQAIGGAMKKCLQTLLRGQIKLSWEYIQMTGKLLALTTNVLLTRKTNKSTNQAIL